jgi:hypothetical protein
LTDSGAASHLRLAQASHRAGRNEVAGEANGRLIGAVRESRANGWHYRIMHGACSPPD